MRWLYGFKVYKCWMKSKGSERMRQKGHCKLPCLPLTTHSNGTTDESAKRLRLSWTSAGPGWFHSAADWQGLRIWESMKLMFLFCIQSVSYCIYCISLTLSRRSLRHLPTLDSKAFGYPYAGAHYAESKCITKVSLSRNNTQDMQRSDPVRLFKD